MHTATLTIKNPAIHAERLRAMGFWTLVIATILCAGIYCVLINRTVLNIVASQRAQAQVSVLDTQIGQLQSANIALSSEITPQYAASIGFSETPSPSFIYYQNSTGNLSINSIGTGR